MKKYIPILLILILSIIAWASGIFKYISFSIVQENQVYVGQFINNYYVLSLIIFGIIYILVVALSLPVASVMTILGGILFNQINGTLVVIVSATIGATILFFSAKSAGAEFILKKIGKMGEKMQNGFLENSFSYLLTLRLIPLFPFSLINLASAFFKIPIRTFFFATLIGIAPGSYVYVSIGVAIQSVFKNSNLSPSIIIEPKIIIALTGLGILSILPIIYKKIRRKNNAR